MLDKTISNCDLDLDYVIPAIDITEEELRAIIYDAESIISENKVDSKKLAIAYLKKAQCLQKIEANIDNFDETQCQIKRIIEKAMELSPNMPEAVMQMGKYSALCEHEKAIADFSDVVFLRPDMIKAFLLRGLAYLSIGDKNKAKEDFDEYLRRKNKVYTKHI